MKEKDIKVSNDSKYSMKKVLGVLILGIFLISFASALDCGDPLEQNTEIDLIQKCPSCSYVNITSITYPNGTVFLNDEMTQFSVNFNYTLPDSSQIGIVTYGTIGDKNGVNPPKYEELCIEITPTGEPFNTSSKNAAFIIAMSLLTILALFLAWLSFKMEHNIVKIGILSFSILIMIFNIGFVLNIMEDTLGSNNTFYSSFSNLYIVAIILSVVLTIGLILWLIVIALKVYKIKRGFGDGLD